MMKCCMVCGSKGFAKVAVVKCWDQPGLASLKHCKMDKSLQLLAGDCLILQNEITSSELQWYCKVIRVLHAADN